MASMHDAGAAVPWRWTPAHSPCAVPHPLHSLAVIHSHPQRSSQGHPAGAPSGEPASQRTPGSNSASGGSCLARGSRAGTPPGCLGREAGGGTPRGSAPNIDLHPILLRQQELKAALRPPAPEGPDKSPWRPPGERREAQRERCGQDQRRLREGKMHPPGAPLLPPDMVAAARAKPRAPRAALAPTTLLPAAGCL